MKDYGDTVNGTNPTSTTVPDSLKPYLQATRNCQVNDSRITADVQNITAGITDPYKKAVTLYNWLHNHLSYQFYDNTRKGTVRTLTSGYGNCCDEGHLMVAFTRAAGIPARYMHVNGKFSSGTYGHIIAQLYLNGNWLNADLTSRYNALGVVKNWTLVGKALGYYRELPF